MSAAGGEATAPEPAPGAARATSVGTHYLRYSSANIAVLLAGFVSFPILTRLLDNTQYGILGYYETWIALSVAVLKFGAQHEFLVEGAGFHGDQGLDGLWLAAGG